tara:strand:- start:1997 stop:2173 length:177 start_codon:yes stop_codon:yes gene_type:complete
MELAAEGAFDGPVNCPQVVEVRLLASEADRAPLESFKQQAYLFGGASAAFYQGVGARA